MCDENSKINLQVLQQNILVAQIDHSLSIENDHVTKLIAVQRRLSEPSFRKQYAIFIAWKAKFLSNKLKLRILHESKGIPIYNIINGTERKIDFSDMLGNSIYDDWLRYSNVYTLESELIQYLRTEFDKIRDKPLNERTTLELHKTIKYFKDVDKVHPNSFDVINDVEKEFKKRLDDAIQQKNKFNSYAFSICGNYAANNRLSIKCEDGSASISEVEELYKQVIGTQSRTGIKNFFAQVKFLSFLIEKIRRIFKSNSALKGLIEARDIINKCHKVDEDYRENVKWTADYYNYVFQLPFDECCLPNKNEEVDRIFVFSSFLLPLPKNKILKEYDEYQAEVAKYESSIVISENVNKEIVALDSLKDGLEGLKDKEYRMLEVLGIFTAIISFVAASLPTFRVIDTVLEGALFMLALATSLAVFVLLILITFRGVDKVKEHKGIIYKGILGTLTLWLLLILVDKHFFSNPKDESDTAIQKSVESEINNSNVNTINNILTYPSSDNRKSVKGKVDIQVSKTVQDSLSKTPCPCPCK